MYMYTKLITQLHKGLIFVLHVPIGAGHFISDIMMRLFSIGLLSFILIGEKLILGSQALVRGYRNLKCVFP